MNNLSNMIWIEGRKAIRSRLPVWTALGALFMPLGIAFLIFVATHPEISKKLGLISAKANLVAYAAIDWAAYLVFVGLFIAAGGFFLFVIILSWVFGREFADGVVKDLLAVPVPRASILLAKFLVSLVWSIGLTTLMFAASLAMGMVIQLPGGTLGVILRGGGSVLITALLTILVVTPFALLASLGRGYLLPMGMAALILMMANLVALTGRGEYFPWAVPGLFAQGKSALPAVSYIIVFLTGLAGIAGTYFWWKYADQNR